MAQPRHNSRQIGHDRLLLEQNPFSSPPLTMTPPRRHPMSTSNHTHLAVRYRESRLLLKTLLLPPECARPWGLGSFPIMCQAKTHRSSNSSRLLRPILWGSPTPTNFPSGSEAIRRPLGSYRIHTTKHVLPVVQVPAPLPL